MQIAAFNPTTTSQGSFIFPFDRGTMRIKNDSSVNIFILINNLASEKTIVQSGQTVDIPIAPPYKNVYWSTAFLLNTNVKSISSVVWVEAYEPGEELPDATGDLPRYSNIAAVGFSTFLVQPVAAANNWLALALFNPANSGVDAILYTALVQQDGPFCSPRLTFVNVDPNLVGISVTTYNRTIGGPSSALHATAQNNLAANIGGFAGGDIARCGNNAYDFIGGTDQVLIHPGFGSILQVQLAATTTNCQFTKKWTEQTISVPTLFTESPGIGRVLLDTTSSGGATPAPSLTLAHTIGNGSNRIYIALIRASDPATITFAGQTMTRLIDNNQFSNPAGPFSVGGLYYLLNPPTGTNNLVVTTGVGTDIIIADAISYSNVNQTTPFGLPALKFSQAGDAPNNVVITSPNQLVLDATIIGDNVQLTPNNNQTLEVSQPRGDQSLYIADIGAIGGNMIFNWTPNAPNVRWVEASVGINPAS